MKVIFLDFDGVLNCEEAYERRLSHGDECGRKEITNRTGRNKDYQQFYSESKKWLNKLIEETDAKIVVSSSWRKSGINFIRDVWRMEQMSGEIIDLTPSLYLQKGGSIQFYTGKQYEHPTPKIRGYSIPRGCEIEYWLKDKGFYNVNWCEDTQQRYIEESGIENYIIIDDDSDMLYNQRNHFVNVLPSPRNKKGFTEEHYLKGKQILSKNKIDINKEL